MRAAVATVAAAAGGAFLLAGGALLGDPAERPAFLADKLGSSVESAPRHVTASGARVDLGRSGYELRARPGRVAIASADESGAAWSSFEKGSVRATPYGEETVVVEGEVVEQFLTVTERTGPKRWRWRLETGALEPSSRPDGSILVTAGNLVAGFRILPAAILDADGDDVTPAGTRWQLERRNGGWWLALDLDDRELPLPYVIDPATIALRAGQGANNGGGATTLTIAKPAGLAVDDQMIAQVTARGGTATFICPPAGWASVDRRNSTTTLAQEVFRKTATAADVAAANFAFTLDNTAGCGSPTALKASGGIIAHYGVDNSSPISGVNGQSNASSANIAAPTVTPGANDVLLGVYGTATGTTVTPPAGTPTFTERWDQASTGGGAGTRTTSQLSSALAPGGATGTKTAVAGAAAVNIGQLVSLRLDTTSPAVPSVGVTESDADTHISGTTLYYRSAGNGGSFDVTATSSDGESGLKHIAFPALAAGFTPITTLSDTTSPYARTYSWSGGATESGAKTVTAEDNATNQSSATFTITPDNAVPTGGALTVNGTAATGGGSTSTSSGSFAIARTDYTDAVSGLASSTLTRDSAPYTNDACGLFSGSPTVLVGAPAQNLTAGCYRYVLTGTDNVGNAVSLQTDVLVHGAATQIALTGSTADLASGANRVLTATVRDASGNTVVSDSATVVSFSKQSGAGTVSGTGTATAANGVATKTVTGVLAGPVTMEATAGGLTTGTLGAFTVVHGAATQIALTGSTTDLASGATRLLTATIRDAAGNTVTSDSSTVVAIAQASGTGTVAGTGNATAANGVATKTVTGALAGTVAMEATAAGLADGTLGAFTVVHGAATQIELTGATTDLTSGSNRLLTATIRDAAGNTVTSDSSTVVAFAKSGGSGTLTGLGNATAASGVATTTVTGAAAGTVNLSASSAGLADGALSFAVVHGAAAQIELTGSTADLVSGANRLLTATIRDAAGNTVTADSSTVIAFAQAAGAGTVTGTGNATAANGVATKLVTGGLAGAATMEATAAGLADGTLAAFTVVHGAATQIELTGSTADLTSGANRVLTATLRDAAGNTVTADSSTVVAFAQASGAGTVTGTGSSTAANGVATKTVTGSLAGAVSLQATAAGLADGTLGAFTVVHGAAAGIELTGSTADLASGANRVLTATVRDAAGNTVTSDSSTVVAFAQASGAGTVTGTGNATAANGVATKTVTGGLAGPVVMEATAAGLATGTLGSFTVVHGAAAQIELTGSTTDLASGANRVLTATIRDAAGNPVASDSSTVVAFAKTGGVGTVTGTGNATASNGVATKTVTGGLAGPVAMEATAAGLATGTLGAFTVVHGAAAQIELTGATADLASGASRVLTATIRDAAGNTVTSDSSTVVAFAKASGAGTVTGTGNATAANGVATKTVTGELVGAVAMQATAAGLADGTLGAFTVVHGAAAQIELTGSTADLTSGATRVLTATLKDAAGNVATGDSSTVVAFAQASGAGSVTGTGNATAASGVATKTVTGALAGSVTMEATAAGLTTGTLGAFTVVHGAAAQIALTGSTADLASGASRVVTATVQDAAGNTIAADNSTAVAFAQTGGTGSVTGLGGSEVVVAGVATKTVTGELAGSVALEATASALADGTLGFDVVHGSAVNVTVSAALTDLASGSTRVLTATVRDAAGNRVAADNTTVVTFAKDSGAGTVTGLGTDTAAAGIASETVTGGLAGAITIVASAPGLVGDNVSFDVVHGPAAAVELTGSTADLASGANRVLTATIRDAAGNPVASDSSTVVAFAKTGGVGTVTGTGNATASNGVATKTVTGALAGSVTMEAAAAGLTTGTLGAFTVVHGAAAQIELTGSTADLASGGNRVLTATIRDAAGNTVTSDSSTVVAFAKAAGAGSVTGTGTATAANGVAAKTVTGALAGAVTMEAAAAGLATGTLGAFTVVHGAPAQIDLGHSGSTASGDNHTLTATLKDAAGNVATGDSSTVVTFAKTGGPGTVTGLGSATASSGVATRVVVNAAAGQIDLDAQSAGLATGTASYTIGAGSGSTATSTIGASPTSLVADGSSTSAITVRLKDAAGNDLPGSGGVVTLSLVGAGSLSAVTDNGDGTYSATLTSPTSVGGATVTGTLNAAALAATAGVTYTHGPAAQIALGESGSTVAGNGHTLTATIQDANGNTVTSDNSTVVAFAKTGGPGTVTGLGTATASGGVATLNVTNMLAGSIDVDAQSAGLAAGTASWTIVTGPVSADASDSTVVAAPATVYANGSDTATITVTLRDAGGNPVPGKTVTLAQGGGGSTISGGGSTNAAGVVAFAVSNTGVETVTYTATDTTDSITLDDDATVDFTFQDANPPTNTVTLTGAAGAVLTGSTLYYNGAAGGSFALSSAVADGGSGPASAAYPAVARPGWAHGAETVSTPAGGPFVSSAFTFAAGATGDFSYVVTAADAWAPPNTSAVTLDVVEDSTAPAAAILCGGAACPAGWSTSAPVSVTLAAPDAGAGLDQIRYTTDGSDPTILTGTVYSGAFDVAAEGLTTVKYRAFDRVGNATGVLAQSIRIDTVAPDTAIDSTPAAATQDTTPTFAFSSPEGGSTFEVRLNGGSWTSETSPLTLGPLAQSTYTFDVRATDAAGNVDASPASFVFTVDTTPADTTITAAPAAATSSTGATFSFTASDAGPGFECSLDGGAFADCSSPKSYAGLTEAAHTFEVRAKDAAGNLDPTPATHAWTVDLTAPDTSFLAAPASPSANPAPTFSLGSTEAPSTFECNLDGGGWAPCATPFTTPALPDGSHTLEARATDAAGNTDASEVEHTWLVDATAPTGSVTAPTDGADVGGTIALASDSADAGGSGVATVVFQRSPATANTWTSQAASWDTTLQADGDYDVRVVTTDNAGNAFISPVVTVTVDNTEPALSVVAPNPVNLATADPATVTATATDDGTGVANVRFDQCAEDSPACVSDSWVLLGLDTGAPYAASWPIPSDGPRLLRVRATDEAGRQKTELVLVTVDRIRPAGSLTSPAAGANLRGAAVALAATASDTAPGSVNTVTFQASPAGAGAWTDVAIDATAPYTGTLDTTALADGLYDLRVFTTDAAGNAEAAPATIQVRVDNTLPTGSVTSPAAAANLRGTVALASDSADAGSGVATVQFQRSPAGAGSWTMEAASFDTTAVADGLYDLRVTTTDAAGNAFTSAAVTVRIDNLLPTGSVTAPANGAEIGVAPVTLTSDSADGGSGVASVVFQRSPAGAGTWTATPATWDTASGPDAVADGSYDLRVRTTDNAGNVFTSAPVTVLVDHTAPTTTASLAPGSPSNAPVTVGFAAGDGAGSGVSVTSYRVDGGSLQAGAAVVIPAPGDHSNDGAHVVEFFSTDEVGNVEALKSVTVVIDTTAPSGSGGDPGDFLRGLATLTYATGATDVSSVQFQFSPAGAGAWSNVGPADLAPPYEASWNTVLVADGPYDLRAVVTDTTGNVANTLLPGLPKTVDNTAPSGSVTAPVAGAFVAGSLAVDANATDGAVPPASGVSAVRFEVKPSGAGAFGVFGTEVAPVVGSTYRATLATDALADGPTELRVVVTDVAGNETTSATTTVTVDNDAPVVALDDPGAAVGASAALSATSSADTATVAFRYRAVGAGGLGALIDTDATAPFAVTWSTAPTAETQWELIAVATDGGGNTTTSAPRTVLVDRTQPTGGVTAPTTAAIVGGPAVALAVAAADTGGSGVVLVEWQVKEFGSGTFATVASDAAAPYAATWDSTTAPDGATEIRAVITDAVGNTRTTAVVPVTVDSTGPSVTLADPGATLAGTVALSAVTGGGAVRVAFAVSPADAGTWTPLGEDTSVPYGADLDTAAFADGLHDLRAIGFDALGNASAPSVREDVRFDNTAPSLLSSAPADGSVSGAVSQIELTASEPVTIVGATLDGGPAPAPSVSGTTITYSTGALADGLHVLFGWLEDASGARTPFRVALTVEAAPLADRPPVERSISPSAATSAVAVGSLAAVTVAPPAWPTQPDPDDFLVVRVDPVPTAPSLGAGLVPAGQMVDVTARWALAGTGVTEFAAPIEILLPSPSGDMVFPATSDDGTSWRALAPLAAPTLPAGARDGYYVDGAGVHILTRHLTLFALGADVEGPTAPHSVAGEMRADGLTIRWLPGRDNSGRLGNVVLYVNGEPYRTFGPTEYEAKLGPLLENDTRSFHLVQHDAAGNASPKSVTLRALPKFLGLGLEAARAALSQRGIAVGDVTYRDVPGAAAETVIGPESVIFFVEGGAIDLVVARGTAAPETKLAFSVAGASRVKLSRTTTIAVRINLTKPAAVAVTLRDAKKQRLHTWKLKAKAGANVVELRLPPRVRRPGTYTLTWVARSGSETISRTLRVTLVGPKVAQARPAPNQVELVLAGDTPAGDGLEPGRDGTPRRLTSVSGPDEAFELVAASHLARTVFVVDADVFGTRFVGDLRTVFPTVRVIAISREPATRALALRAGAVRALPRSAPSSRLAKAIAAAASS